MNAYETLIAECAAKAGAVESLAHIEAWMRIEHPTLDGLSPAAFRAAVFDAIDCVRAVTPAENDALAASYGLRPSR